MEQHSAAAPIVSPWTSKPYTSDLVFVRKVVEMTDGRFFVTNSTGNLLFQVKRPVPGLRDQRVIVDASGLPIYTLREKIISKHDRWQAFTGRSTKSSDLQFTVKRSSSKQLKTHLHVFMAGNKFETVCDYKVEGSWFERSYVVKNGETDNIIAQMHKKHATEGIFVDEGNFSVASVAVSPTVPNVFYAMIVAFIVILDTINKEGSTSSSTPT